MKSSNPTTDECPHCGEIIWPVAESRDPRAAKLGYELERKGDAHLTPAERRWITRRREWAMSTPTGTTI